MSKGRDEFIYCPQTGRLYFSIKEASQQTGIGITPMNTCINLGKPYMGREYLRLRNLPDGEYTIHISRPARQDGEGMNHFNDEILRPKGNEPWFTLTD